MGITVEEIIENGTTYIVETHDDGFICKHIKYKGPPSLDKEKAAKDKVKELDLSKLGNTDEGKALLAILYYLGILGEEA